MSVGPAAHMHAWTVRWTPLVLPGVVTFALGLWGLGRISMFGSEADTYWAAHLPVPHLVRLLSHIDAVHGTYYLLMHAWFELGSGVAWMRLPSVLGMTVAAVVTSTLATRLSGSRRVGLVAGVLFALTPSISTWGQNARSYALVCAAVAVMTRALLWAVEAGDAGSRRPWVGFGAAVAVSGYLHEMTLLLAVSYGITLLGAGASRAVMRRWLITTTVSAVLVVPVVVASVRERDAVDWLRRPGLAGVRALLQQSFGTSWPVVVALSALVLIAALPLLSGPARTGRISLPMLALPMLVVPGALLILESEVRHPLYDPRYVLYSTIAASMLAASGADRIAGVLVRAARRRPGPLVAVLGAVPAVALCLSVAVQQWPVQRYLRTTASRSEDYLAAARFLHDRAAPGDGLLFMNPTARSADLAYPADFRGVRDIATLRSPEDSGTFRGITCPAAAVLSAIRSTDRVWVLGPYPLRRDPRGLAGTAGLLSHGFRPAVVGRFPGVVDVRYDRIAPVVVNVHRAASGRHAACSGGT